MASRICMVVHAYYPVREPRVQREAEALVDGGYEVDVLCLRRPGEPAQERSNGVAVYRLPVHRHKGRGLIIQFLEYIIFLVLASWKLARLHLRRHYLVVQVHTPPDFLVFSACLPKLQGSKVILDIHDVMPEFFAARTGQTLNGLPARILRLQESLSCAFSDHVITVTDLWRETLISRGLSPEKCSVVMNVADDQIFHPIPPETATSHSNGFHLIYHGNITHRYGLDILIKAVALARKTVPDLQLTIHGHGDYLPELQQLVSEMGLQKCVHFSTQLLPLHELPSLILRADAGIVPYRQDIFTDGILPTKLMEYAALNMPVIAAKTTAIKTYFDEDMVEFFEPGNIEELKECIVRLHRDQERRQHLARAIGRFSQHHSWNQQRQAYIKLINRLITEQTNCRDCG
ncbi:MAG: glycosyltransferase family 4 protein [Anaerolineae bacterium]|nr:glycosyltransferase family 4 protein [Anaerolineae bacterium]